MAWKLWSETLGACDSFGAEGAGDCDFEFLPLISGCVARGLRLDNKRNVKYDKHFYISNMCEEAETAFAGNDMRDFHTVARRLPGHIAPKCQMIWLDNGERISDIARIKVEQFNYFNDGMGGAAKPMCDAIATMRTNPITKQCVFELH